MKDTSKGYVRKQMYDDPWEILERDYGFHDGKERDTSESAKRHRDRIWREKVEENTR